jgi:hypothetical protein
MPANVFWSIAAIAAAISISWAVIDMESFLYDRFWILSGFWLFIGALRGWDDIQYYKRKRRNAQTWE